MRSRPQFLSAVAAIGLGLAAAWPVRAAAPDFDRFKGEIDAFVAGLGGDSNGAVSWLGSDPYDIHRDGDSLVAVIAHARLALQMPEAGRLVLDRVEIRRTGEKDGGKFVDLDVKLPSAATLYGAPVGPLRIALKDATAKIVVETATGHSRATDLTVAGGRVDDAGTGGWIGFGPLSLTAKLIPVPGGGWSAPVAFELKHIAFFAVPDQVPVAGTVERIHVTGTSAGPDLAAYNKWRDAVDALKRDPDAPEVRLRRLWALLPAMTAVLSGMRAEIGVEGLSIHQGDAQGDAPLLALARGDIALTVSGLDGEDAALRLLLRHSGLQLAPSLLAAARVPRRAVVDVGIEHLDSKALASLLAAAGAINAADTRDQQQALRQLLGAAATLAPTYRIYDAALDTQDFAAELTGTATGWPLAGNGYSAAADLTVRGLGALRTLAPDLLFLQYLPVLEEMAATAKGPDGTPRAEFHIASTAHKLLTVNGYDAGAWFAASAARPGEPRLLKPALPPMRGGDVTAVQHALAAAHIAVAQNGVYTAATAGAVARFQKKSGLDVDGVVDAETRRRLGLSAASPRQRGRN